MEKTKLLTLAIFALLLLNIGTLGFLILSKPHRHPMQGPHSEPKNLIIEKLHFDKPQQEKYESLIQWHRSQISAIETRIRNTKNKLYLQLLKPDIDQKAKDSLIASLADEQKQIEITHFTHFEEIKKLCRPEQIDEYNDLTQELSRIFSKPQPQRHD